MLNDVKIYGRELTGNETPLELEQLKRVQYLKQKMRKQLRIDMGDDQDNMADLLRGLVLGLAIQRGDVADQTIKDRYSVYLADMLAGYGGPGAIMDILEKDKTALEQNVMMGYYLAKQDILAVDAADFDSEAEAIEAVRHIDLPGEPVIEDEVDLLKHEWR
jgi:hypothetical protein